MTKFWFGEIITIGQVKFHPETFRPYYFDCAANKKQKEKELDEIIQEQRKEIVISEVGQKHLK